jgi:translation initiation factor IF-2
MNKIRINELARELEVKAHEILDRLPELGVTEKKTHSSSIDEDVAIKLRRLLTGESPEEFAEPEARAATPPHGRPPVETSLAPALEVSPGGPGGPAAGHAAIEEKAAWSRPPEQPRRIVRRPPIATHSSAIGWQFAAGRAAHAPVAPRIAYPYAPSPAAICARPSHATRGQTGSTRAARPGAVRTAPTDAARRQRTDRSPLGADFHQTRCGRARPQRSHIGGKPRPAHGARHSDTLRAQTARAPARRTACRASRSAAACGSGSQAEPAPRRFARHARASAPGRPFSPGIPRPQSAPAPGTTHLPWTAPSRPTRRCAAGPRSGRPPRRPHAPRRRTAPHASHVAPSGYGTRRRAAAARSAAPPRQ